MADLRHIAEQWASGQNQMRITLNRLHAWLYQRTRSLLMLWLAHLAVSAVTVGLLLGVVPGLPHRHDLLQGEREQSYVPPAAV